jgi:hypothetical protein
MSHSVRPGGPTRFPVAGIGVADREPAKTPSPAPMPVRGPSTAPLRVSRQPAYPATIFVNAYLSCVMPLHSPPPLQSRLVAQNVKRARWWLVA